ncbi:MAG: hypothetical protein AAGA28_03630 [Pseudomonadota bacterium]
MTPKPRNQELTLPQALGQQKWLTLVALPILTYAMIHGLFFVWGLLFLFWGAGSLASGRIFLVEDIDRQSDPALFWIVFFMWIGSGVTYVYYDLTRFF